MGDTASFSCTVTTLDDKPVTPTLENTLTFYIDDIGFSKQAIIDNGQYEFIIAGSDTLPLEEGVYNYRVVYETESGEQYTIFQDVFIELLGDKEKSDPEPTPEPEPEPDPDIDLDPDPEIVVPAEGTYAITIGNPVCYVGDTVIVKMRIAPEVASVDFRIPGDSNYLQMLSWAGGLGNAVISTTAEYGKQLSDYKSTGASIAEYEFSFKTLKSGTANLTFYVNEICDNNGNQLSGDYSSSSTVTIRSI